MTETAQAMRRLTRAVERLHTAVQERRPADETLALVRRHLAACVEAADVASAVQHAAAQGRWGA